MSRIIRTNTLSKDRTQLLRTIFMVISDLSHCQGLDDQTKDMAAFIVLCLEAIFQNIERSLEAWEKRGYWVKADRFRSDWIWTINSAGKLRTALEQNNWDGIAHVCIQVGMNLNNIKVPKSYKIGTPWVGAWDKFRQHPK